MKNFQAQTKYTIFKSGGCRTAVLENNGKTDRAGYGTFKHKQSIKFYPSNRKILGEKSPPDKHFQAFSRVVAMIVKNKNKNYFPCATRLKSFDPT